MKRHYTTYTKEILEPIAASSYSYSQCLDKLSIKKAGGNYKNLQKNLDKFQIDYSHFTHQAHNRGKELIPLENLKRPDMIKKRLVKERGHCCESCGLHTWQEKTIILELHHMDGNSRNNSRDNLQILCPNCHSLTYNWRGRK